MHNKRKKQKKLNEEEYKQLLEEAAKNLETMKYLLDSFYNSPLMKNLKYIRLYKYKIELIKYQSIKMNLEHLDNQIDLQRKFKQCNLELCYSHQNSVKATFALANKFFQREQMVTSSEDVTSLDEITQVYSNLCMMEEHNQRLNTQMQNMLLITSYKMIFLSYKKNHTSQCFKLFEEFEAFF